MAEKQFDIKEGGVDAARARLYEREAPQASTPLERYTHEKYKAETEVQRAGDWEIPDEAPVVEALAPVAQEVEAPKRSYRALALTFGVVFFVLSSAIAALYLVFGNQDISGSNIRISVDAPYAVGGGSEAAIVVSVTNQNETPITDVQLIVEYPQGTEIDGERSRELVVKKMKGKTFVCLSNIESRVLRQRFIEKAIRSVCSLARRQFRLCSTR